LGRQGSSRRGAASFALCFCRLALAEAGEDQPVELPEVVVRLPRLPRAPDTTAAATVVEADRYAGEAKDVAALVATSPGVAVQEYGGLGQLSTVSIRGSTASGVKILLDGMDLNTGAGGGVDLSTIPRAWISSIEIVRGAEGARWGAGALGGVVNVVTRPAAPGSWSAQLAGGSFLTGSASGEVSSGGDGFGALLSLGLDGTRARFPYAFDNTPSAGGGLAERLRDHNAAASAGVLAKAWARTDEGRIDVLAQLSGGVRQVPGDPYSDASAPGPTQSDGRALASLRYARPLADGLRISLGLEGRGEWLNLSMAGSPLRQRDAAGRLRAEITWNAGPNLLVAGLHAGGERLAADGLGSPRSRADLAAWVSDDLLVFSGLRLAPALRAERQGSFAGVSGKLGAGLAIWGPLSVRASSGRTYRAPSFSELHLEQALLKPNPDLRPETGVSADAALVVEGREGLASLGAFAALYDDLIVYIPVFQGWGPRNVGRASMRGLEAELATAPLSPLGATAQLSYTYLTSETLRGAPAEVGREVPHRARHRLFARAGLAPGGWGVHAEMHHVGRQWMDSLNRQPIPAALTFHVGGSVRLWNRPELWLHVDVKNLLDDRTLQDGFGNPLPGRLLMVALRAGSNLAFNRGELR
jgi:iron complex outermembrane receptor protein